MRTRLMERLVFGSRLLLTSALVAWLMALVVSEARAADWAEATVMISDKGFDPAVLTVPPKTRVTWINKGTIVHSTTDDRMFWDSGGLAPPSQSVGKVIPGGSFSYLFNTYDVWTYHSEPDAYFVGGSRQVPLTGAIVVSGAVTQPTGTLPLPQQAAPAEGPPLPPNTIVVVDGKYYPNELKVKLNDTVTWTNYGGNVHTVTDDNRMLFDSGGLSQPQDPPIPESSFSYRFTKRGVYRYHSETDVDPTNPKDKWMMRGTIIVQ